MLAGAGDSATLAVGSPVSHIQKTAPFEPWLAWSPKGRRSGPTALYCRAYANAKPWFKKGSAVFSAKSGEPR